jgi:hypothetical protein
MVVPFSGNAIVLGIYEISGNGSGDIANPHQRCKDTLIKI